MKKRLKNIMGIDNKSIVRLLIGNTCYRLMALVLLIELLKLVVKAALKVKGHSYLTNANIKSMLTSPLVIAMLMVIFFVALLVTLAETSALVVGIAETESGEDFSWGRVIFGGIKGVSKLKQKSYVLLMIPATIIQLLLMLWIRVRYIYEMEKAGTLSVVLILLFILSGIIAFIAEIIAACMICEDITVKEAWRIVVLIFRKHIRYILKELAIISLLIAIAAFIVYIMLVIVITMMVVLLLPSGVQLAMTMTISNYLARFFTILYINATTVINLCIIIRFCVPRFIGNDGRAEPHVLSLMHGYENSYLYKKKKLCFVAIVTLCTSLLFFYGYDSISNGMLMGEKSLSAISISSHRGASLEAPENTLPAIERAIENMADYVEIDVQETLDGRLVVIHDLSLMRTGGTDLYVSDLTYRQLRRYDVGAWFSGEYTYTKIPTLEEVLELSSGRVGLNIELKRTKSGGDLASKVVELVKQYNMEDKVVMSSSDYKYLREIKTLDDALTTGYILTSLMGGGYEDKNIDFYSINYSYVTASVVEKIHSCGKGIHVWTVNNRSSIERMKRYGVDNIITDSPVMAREVLYDNSAAATIFDILRRIF